MDHRNAPWPGSPAAADSTAAIARPNVVVRQDGHLSVLDWETISLDDPLLDLGMAAVGLAQDAGNLAPARLDALLSGYPDIAPLSDEDAAALPMEIVHAALSIAFHRYYRHNIRFPDPAKSSIHNEMLQFVDSVEKMTSLRG
ncbi:phosphotransferase [Streptomyces sp. A73]|nr:phosphotransferase [Streptomyces sp. A73]